MLIVYFQVHCNRTPHTGPHLLQQEANASRHNFHLAHSSPAESAHSAVQSTHKASILGYTLLFLAVSWKPHTVFGHIQIPGIWLILPCSYDHPDHLLHYHRTTTCSQELSIFIANKSL